jgi:hypothetical protein
VESWIVTTVFFILRRSVPKMKIRIRKIDPQAFSTLYTVEIEEDTEETFMKAVKLINEKGREVYKELDKELYENQFESPKQLRTRKPWRPLDFFRNMTFGKAFSMLIGGAWTLMVYEAYEGYKTGAGLFYYGIIGFGFLLTFALWYRLRNW